MLSRENEIFFVQLRLGFNTLTVKHYIARRRLNDGEIQSLECHLNEVADFSGSLAQKVGAADAGRLTGGLHDFGKYSGAFQNYIESANGQLDSDAEEYVDATLLRGKIDHSSAGAQWAWQALSRHNIKGAYLCGQIVALCIASHHSGLIDCLQPDGTDGFKKRMRKPDDKTHLQECAINADPGILSLAESLTGRHLIQDMLEPIKRIVTIEHRGQTVPLKLKCFYIGLWTRFLFSGLIDADRVSSADFENPSNSILRNREPDWDLAIRRSEQYFAALKPRHKVDEIRRSISDDCLQRAGDPQGIFTLSVPTGGGKTYATLRYALHHAKAHKLDRIIYVIPYTSIIEQNAAAIRDVIERPADEFPWVLENHSNLEPEQQNWHSKLVSENWDAPIVMTTMVQFLEVLFAGGTRSVRRLHQLGNSVVVFDEIQTLPVNCVHLFCNAINFLQSFAGMTAVLCTATQPVLDKLRAPEKGHLHLKDNHELIGNSASVQRLFQSLERVQIKNQLRAGGWSEHEIAELAIAELEASGSCLVVVNTKVWAKTLYERCTQLIGRTDSGMVFHLSTNQCPVHRKKILDVIRECLDNELPLLCISTQLIEAGVDVDFGGVIRFLAGLDSIAQAAGRCNRNGRRERGVVHVVNPNSESIDLMADMKAGRDIAERLLGEVAEDQLLTPQVMERYYQYYFFDRAEEMSYTVTSEKLGRTDTLLNLLSDNPLNVGRDASPAGHLKLQQSFMSAGKLFKVIDAPTEAIIVPYQDGKKIIAQLCAVAKDFELGKYSRLIRQAQKYSVNVFPNLRQRLTDAGALQETQPGDGIYYLLESFYDEAFGVSEIASGKVEPVIL